MSDHPKPRPTSAAAGAKYHAVAATEAWREYEKGVDQVAERTVAQREARTRARDRSATYHREHDTTD